MFFRKKKIRLTKIQLTKQLVENSFPIRNPDLKWYENDEGEVVITVPKARKSKFNIIPVRDKVVILDKNGSEIWHLCTGTKKVEEIIKDISMKMKLDITAAETSVMKYINQLAYRGIIGLRILNESGAEWLKEMEPHPE